MKKTNTYIGLIIFVLFVITACVSNKPERAEDINVSELSSVCDFVDAVEIVVDEIIVIKDNKDWKSFTDEEIAQIEKLFKILEEIDAVAEKKFTNDEAKTCPSYERVNSKMAALD
jgi:hypothetical protein